jgi:hypothetical protein
MSKAGVSERVIIAVIDRDKTVFTMNPDQLVTLQQEGVTEPVILAMLKSGEAGDEAARQTAAVNEWFYFMNAAPYPQVAVVGASPQDVEAARIAHAKRTAPVQTLIVPYAVPVIVAPRHRARAPLATPPRVNSTRGIFFEQPTTGIFFTPPPARQNPPAQHQRPR